MRNYFYSSLIILAFILGFTGCAPAIIGSAESGDLQGVKAEVDNGADVNTKNNGGMTPLHYAALQGHLEVIKYLVSQGADVNVKNVLGATPLHGASLYGHIKIVKYLVSQGADVNVKDDSGLTPLHYAAQQGHLEVIKYLVSQGADINALNSDGKTPYQLAYQNDRKDIAAYLKNEAFHKEKQKEEQIVKDLVARKDFEGLKNYTDKNPNAVYYISDSMLRLAMTGPQGMKVGDIRKLVKSGKDEVIIISLIKRVKTPYKEFTLEEIEYLRELGLSSNIISAMMDRTTKLLDDKRLKEQQAFFLAEQERIAKENAKTNMALQSQGEQRVDAQGNPIVEKVQDELVKQGVGMLLDRIF